MTADPRTLPFWDEELRRMSDDLLPAALKIYFMGGLGGEALLKPNAKALISWDVFNQDAIDWLRKWQHTILNGVNDTTRRQVVGLLTDWVQSGEPLPSLVKQVASLPTFSKRRAEQIAVTEVTRMYAEGNLAAWRATGGVVGGKRWNTANDDKVCPACSPLHGMVVGLNENGFTTEAGGMGITAPPAHPGCRCWLTPVVDEQGFREGLRNALGERPNTNIPINIQIRVMNDDIYKIYGYEVPTAEQQREFLNSINDLPSNIKTMWRGTDPVILASNPDWKYYGIHQSNWIVLGKESFDGTIAQHEFIHHIVSQPYITERLGDYDYIKLFTHAAKYTDKLQRLNEDLTVMLSYFDIDDRAWAKAISEIGEGIDYSEALQKVNSTKMFLGKVVSQYSGIRIIFANTAKKPLFIIAEENSFPDIDKVYRMANNING